MSPAAPVPAEPGTYALLLELPRAAHVQIGRLGRYRFERGCYLYVGSALGPGGLRARLRHHARHAESPRWHVDYLRHEARLSQVWYTQDTRRHEHAWARAAGGLRGASSPVHGFGASDCDCASHLFAFVTRPSAAAFRRRLRGCGHPPVRALGTESSPAGAMLRSR
ncbi:MAG: GIY-YIG nuclease family protein [Deltaproteobacteria bacterium]|nr:GIY-YIG nuclease family protein [Deltaproteobacteria bacterium]